MNIYFGSNGFRLFFNVLYNFIICLAWIMPCYPQTSGLPHMREKRQYGLDDAPAIFIGGPQNRQLGVQTFSSSFQNPFPQRPQPGPYISRPSPSFQSYGPSGRSDYPSPDYQNPFGYQSDPFRRSNGYSPGYQQQSIPTFPYDPNGSWMPGQEPPTPSPRLDRPFPPPADYGRPAQSSSYSPYGSWMPDRELASPSARNYDPPGPQPGYGLPERRPVDLTIPSYAYVPNKITGQGMQYIPNPPVFAAHGMEYYVKNWTDYVNNDFYQTLTGEAVTSGPDDTSTDEPDSDSTTESSLLKQARNPGVVLGSSSSRRNKTRSKDSKVCTSRGSFGVCVNNTRVLLECVGKSITKSLICGRTEMCCLDSGTSNRSSSTSAKNSAVRQRPAASMSKSCVTTERGTIEDGVCVSNDLIDMMCRGKFIRRSGCEGEQSCCVDGRPNDSKVAQVEATIPTTPFAVMSLARQEFPTCIPGGNIESLRMGVCVGTALIGEFCVDQAVSTSSNCDSQEVCCVDISRSLDAEAPDNLSQSPNPEEDSDTAGPVTVRRLRKDPASALRFRSRPDTSEVCFAPQSHVVGLCVADDEIPERCVGKSAFKTGACLSDKSCCVLNTKQETARRKPNRNLNRLRPARRRIPPMTTVPRTTSSTTPPTTTTTPASTTAREMVRPCMAQDDPTTIGFCVNQLQALSLCTSHQISQSRNCFAWQFCCTGSQEQQTQSPLPTTTAVSFGIQGSLSPSGVSVSFQNRFAQCRSPSDFSQLGLCVDEMLVGRFCRDQLVMRSGDCSETQACCVESHEQDGAFIPQRFLRPALPTTTVSTTTPTGDQSFLPFSSYYNLRPCSTPRQFSQYGVCVDDTKLSLYCTNQYISKSFDCPETQTCCIGDNNGLENLQNPQPPVRRLRRLRSTTTTPRTTVPRRTRKSEVIVPGVVVSPQIFVQCIPLVNNFPLGVCVDEAQVEALCTGRMVAPSRSCGIGQSCCSYLPELPMAQALTTTAPVYLTPTTTAAVVVADNSDPLDYEDVQKEVPWRSLKLPTTTTAPPVIQTCTSSSSGVLGVCISEVLAMTDCVGKMIEIASQCDPTQLCCSNS